MKNNKILILLLVLLVAVAVYFFMNKTSGTLNNNTVAKSDFAIKDTASIDKIFIVDANGQQVTLIKKEKVWMVDGEYLARPDNIRLLLKTFSRIDVRSPVPKAANDNVIRRLATGATKVEIYQGEDEPSKIYYVGGATLDHQGTYMLLETDGVKSSVPFIMYIPGNYGYLTVRFFTESEQWRDPVVFQYLPKNIKSITINYFETPEASFRINNTNEGFELFDLASNKKINADTAKLNEYMSRYQRVCYEMIDVESPQSKIDSTIASPPFLSMEVEGFLGNSNKIMVHHMPNFRKVVDANEEEFEYDVDRMYGYLNNELFTYIQFATFDNLTLPQQYFLKK